ncbi:MULTISPECIES: AI-2E family transporter [unclassified Facklamia]|uniref:AI-2E family transporter n=1 Tax=Aerococcaceae TaxID=186827 RepID=UPI0013B856B6|nr:MULTISPECIES: AI-2E family transporter [unclassified Facklamia]NEW64190.1 AI-2E family transporter [Facklamia sp. 252]NEW68277.1 AI-2E family transporter [Facklamia sp. 253]QQD65894.1 AI-2E family transporter [Aerococcaceae bacterium zg-252]
MAYNRKQVIGLGVFLVICFIIVRYWSIAESLLVTIFNASKPFFAGAMIAYIVNILLVGYESLFERFIKMPKLLKFKRGLSLLLAYSTFIVVIAILLGIVIPELIGAIQSLLSIDPSKFQELFAKVEKNETIQQVLKLLQSENGGRMDIASTVTNYIQQMLSTLGNLLLNILTSATGIFSAVFNVFMSIVFSIYLLTGKEKIAAESERLILAYIPKLYRLIVGILSVFDNSFRGFFVSQSLEAVILGCMCMLGMWLLRLPYATTVGILVGSSAFIPVIGAYIGAGLGTFLIFTQSPSQALIFLIYIIVLQQFEGNVIFPRVVGGKVGLPAMWVLVSITIGGALLGLVGMLVAVPIAAALYRLLKANINHRLNVNSYAENATKF